MLTPLLILLGSVALAFCLAQAAWWLYWWWMERWTDAIRRGFHADRVRQQAEAYQRAVAAARQAARRAARSRARTFIDLDGARIRVPADQLRLFRGRCCRELGVEPGASWSAIRRQWRRRSLDWHPDHGGSVAVWLRKQRAYQALEQLDRCPAEAEI